MSQDRDVDDGLTPWERTRRALHRAVERICHAWPRALNDANARGYGTGRDWNDTTGVGSAMTIDGESVPVTGVEMIALNPSKAIAWLVELGDVLVALGMRSTNGSEPWTGVSAFIPMLEAVGKLCDEWGKDAERTSKTVIRLANRACALWPPPLAAGATVDGIKVGERGSDSETCGFCQEPAFGGEADPIRRIDGQPFHKSCSAVVQVSRGTHPGLEHSHGTVNRYNGGCHCEECRAALAGYHKARRRAKLAGV